MNAGREIEVERQHAAPQRSWRWLWMTFCALAFLLLVAVTAYVGPLALARGLLISITEDTEYAPGYSESAFRGIAVGDTEASVRSALGAPLGETVAVPCLRWLYVPDPQPVSEFEKNGAYPDFRFSFTTIDFGADGTFADAFGQISHGSSSTPLGASGSGSFGDGVNTLSIRNADIEKLKAEKATTQQIEERFGRPQARFESKAVKWLQYSRSPGSKNYRQRLVGIDGDGKVCRKEDAIWWD